MFVYSRKIAITFIGLPKKKIVKNKIAFTKCVTLVYDHIYLIKYRSLIVVIEVDSQYWFINATI